MLLERLLRNASPGAVAAPLLTWPRECLLALLRGAPPRGSGGVGGSGVGAWVGPGAVCWTPIP